MFLPLLIVSPLLLAMFTSDYLTLPSRQQRIYYVRSSPTAGSDRNAGATKAAPIVAIHGLGG